MSDLVQVSTTEIAGRADFSLIRYAQCWEDADLLVDALKIGPDDRCLSIASAGDNSFSLLSQGPAHVAAVDLSPAQLHCVAVRAGGYRHLRYTEFLELMGSRPSQVRGKLLSQALNDAEGATRDFWLAKEAEVERLGVAGVGRFEAYFALFRRYVLPLVHGHDTVKALLEPRSPEDRRAFFHKRWRNHRWAWLTRLFFSRAVMGRLGRDPAFFDHVEGGLAEHIERRVRHALVTLAPAENPYLHWILTGTHGAALPHALREDTFNAVKPYLDRLSLHLMSTSDYASLARASGERLSVFNLSNIFEYMSEPHFLSSFNDMLAVATPGARLAYWNMMVPRRASAHRSDVIWQEAQSRRLHEADKAFFYRDFVAEVWSGGEPA